MVSVKGKGLAKMRSGVNEGDEVSKIRYLWHQNRGDGRLTGMSTEGTCLLSVRCPAHRRHDLYLGCYAEHRKLSLGFRP